MTRIKRPFIFGMNDGNISIIVDSEKLTAIEPQGFRDINITKGNHSFKVQSKWFQSKTVNIDIQNDEIIEVSSNIGRYWIFIFIVAMIIPQFIFLMFDLPKSFLYSTSAIAIILSFGPYLPFFSKRAYTIKKVSKS